MKLEWYRESHAQKCHMKFEDRKVFGGYFVTTEGKIIAFVTGKGQKVFKSEKKTRSWVTSGGE